MNGPIIDEVPAAVYRRAAGELRDVRVWATDEEVRIYVNSPNGIVLADRRPIVSLDRRAGRNRRAEGFRGTSVLFADGEEWDVVRLGGCGCSNPLKRYRIVD